MKRFGLLAVLLAGGALLLGGCSRYAVYEPGTVLDFQDKSPAILSLQEVTVPPPQAEPEDKEYRVGAGDVLSVEVAGLIERGTSAVRGQSEGLLGFRVYSSGKIMLPLVGGIEVAGLSVEQIQSKLIDIFSTYIRQPVVAVEIIEFKSQPIYLMGGFNAPGLQYLDRPTSLLHGLAMGGGVADTANMRGARVLRDKRSLPVDIYQLFYNNDQRQNIMLRQGDTIFIPASEDAKVYVMGVVSGVVPMQNGRLNLLQALSTVGAGKGPFNHEHIRLIRTISPTHGQLMEVDLAMMMNGQALPLPLQDGDIVYVPKTQLGGWNEVISELLPTFQLMGAIVSPFMWADALNDDD